VPEVTQHPNTHGSRRGNEVVLPGQRHRVSLGGFHLGWRAAASALCVYALGQRQGCCDSLVPDWPPGAPIQLYARTDQRGISDAEAERKARGYLGQDELRFRLRRAYLTDGDFPFLRPRDLPVWLAEAGGVVIRPRQAAQSRSQQREPVTLPLLYLALDAETGLCVEAFTPPVSDWWAGRSLLGAAHTRFLREDGVLHQAPSIAPQLSVNAALERVQPRPEASAQILVRCVLYSDYNMGWGVDRIEGTCLIPRAVCVPTWVVTQEGMRLLARGRTSAGAYEGRMSYWIDARTGEVLRCEKYGT